MHGFTSLPKEIILRIFTFWKHPSTSAEFEPANLGYSGEHDNHWSMDKVRWDDRLWVGRVPAHHIYRIITGAVKLNGTKWLIWVWKNGGMKFVAEKNGRNNEENLPRLYFVLHETHMEWSRRELETTAVGGDLLTACTTEPPLMLNILK